MGKQNLRPATDDQKTRVRQVFEGVVENLAFEQAEAILSNRTTFEGEVNQLVIGLTQEERVKALGGSEIERWAAFYKHFFGLELKGVSLDVNGSGSGLLVLDSRVTRAEDVFRSLPKALDGLKAHKWTSSPLDVAVARNFRRLGETRVLRAKCVQTELSSFDEISSFD